MLWRRIHKFSSVSTLQISSWIACLIFRIFIEYHSPDRQTPFFQISIALPKRKPVPQRNFNLRAITTRILLNISYTKYFWKRLTQKPMYMKAFFNTGNVVSRIFAALRITSAIFAGQRPNNSTQTSLLWVTNNTSAVMFLF